MQQQRPAPLFIGDHPAIDFLNSTATPGGIRHEWIGDGLELIDWLVAAGLLDGESVPALWAKFGAASVDGVARQARELREWLRRFVERHAGRSLAVSVLGELEPVNRLLAVGQSYRQIAIAEVAPPEAANRLVLHRHQHWQQPEQLLEAVAEAIADLLCQGNFALVRRCEGTGCSLWFYDRTKRHARRWCSMAGCGNRAKAAAHRARSKEAAQADH
ncbi:CGNR zinc finger domain-containing protein [Gloeobacter kilaueensis]|uniref:Zinc finger CGNR domain-containing protein n=1 Tax=Gloeobacter kilaueensis (strain ATCC BAA-2537 / CCAP 1431/1 / ULC 316 / JS1) TaxID=1183438 RepID=U5QN46_GLOK1|nr:ABATE domain-containing protein [Gloeobacter kilaueensis]AGY60331.1 hypothetical protein GKIL_4085 [Gloeobacter kilaueensis JS1]